MPSHSVKQAKVMSAIAHGWRPSGLDIPVKVAKEFHAADAGKKYGAGHKARALRTAKKMAEGGYVTKLSPEQEIAFQRWKKLNASNDSGRDYDLRGAYLANMQKDPESGHMGDRFKMPNHPTFSDQSQYAIGDQRQRAGTWVGPEGADQTFVPPSPMAEGGMAKFAGSKDKMERTFPDRGGQYLPPETVMELLNPGKRFTTDENIGGFHVPVPSADMGALVNPDRIPDERSWNSSPHSANSYAEGGDTSSFDWSGVGQAMPEHIGREKILDPVANAAIGAASMYPRYVQSTVDAAKQAPGSEEAHQAYGDVGRATGDLGLSMIGPKGATNTSGVFVGPYGAMALRNAARETGNMAAERAMVHPVVEKEFARFGKKLSPEERNARLAKTQEERDNWARSTLEERAAKGDFRDRDVFAKSGWSFTADGKPAKEISDVGAKLGPSTLGPSGIYLDKYLYEHPAGDLHKAYDIPPITTRGVPHGAEAAFTLNPNTRGVSIGIKNPHGPESASTAGHEFQHGISFREGWPRGSNAKEVPQSLLEREHFPNMRLPEYQKKMFLEADPKVTRSMLRDLESSEGTASLSAYLHSAGENQAFNTQRRLANPENYLLHPEDTEIVPRVFQMSTYHKAKGGGVGGFNPERGEAIGLAHQGAIKSSVPGRTDKLQLNVLAGSSVVPADVVSGLGQGNTDAGHSVLNKMFTKGPYGMNLPKTKAGMRVGSRHSSLSFTSKGFAGGGEAPTTPIVAAGGEHVLDPQQVAQVGNGDLDLGHSILNAFYEHVRSKNIKTLRKLPGPKNG